MIKIVDKLSAAVSFESLEVGEIFKYGYRIYAKIETVCQSNEVKRNAIQLNGMSFVTFSDSALVVPCKATLIVETKEDENENK